MTVVNNNELVVNATVLNEASVQAGELLRAVARLHVELQHRNFACCDVQSATQCQILTALSRGGEQTLSALSQKLNLDKGWLSRSSDDLVAQGLLEKSPHPTDRRSLLLRLTEAGTLAAHALNDQLNAQASRVLARLPEPERSGALRLLTSLSLALQAELDEERAVC